MDGDFVAVPLWFVKTMIGMLAAGIAGAIGMGLKLLLDFKGLRQLIVGYDGKNGMRGDLELLDARLENVEHDQGTMVTQVALLEEFKKSAGDRIQGLENREREQAA